MKSDSQTHSKRVSIVQSSYIPWKGYFDLIGLADEFIVYDDAQFTKNDWRNRNRIKTAAGVQWLTIPVRHSGRFGQRIDETLISDKRWRQAHWKSLLQNYGRAPYFEEFAARLERLYATGSERLTDVNRAFIFELCKMLEIDTRITSSTDYDVSGVRSERVLALCLASGATEYLSGPSARSYLDEAAFAAAGIRLTYADYSGYPEYPQLHPPFDHRVSVIDLLFHTGPAAKRFMKFGHAT